MSYVRLSVTMTIDAKHVSLLNMPYISRSSNNSGTYGTTGCKQRSYADPYKTLNKKRFIA